MPGLKVTLDAAMRARDVSRPHAEHEADAARADAGAASGAAASGAAGEHAGGSQREERPQPGYGRGRRSRRRPSRLRRAASPYPLAGRAGTAGSSPDCS